MKKNATISTSGLTTTANGYKCLWINQFLLGQCWDNVSSDRISSLLPISTLCWQRGDHREDSVLCLPQAAGEGISHPPLSRALSWNKRDLLSQGPPELVNQWFSELQHVVISETLHLARAEIAAPSHMVAGPWQAAVRERIKPEKKFARVCGFTWKN